MHIFSVVVWLGGLMFQSAVATPIVNFENDLARAVIRKVNLRFVGFIWMSAWTLSVTGVLMMLLNPNFIWFRFEDRWSILLGFKQLIFVLMVFYAFGYARMLKYLDAPSADGGNDEEAALYKHRVHQFRAISIFLGMTALLLAAGMNLNV